MSELPSSSPSSPNTPVVPHRKFPTIQPTKFFWLVLLALLALVLASPVLVIVSNLFQPFTDTFAHLRRTVLPDYIRNSVILMLGVGIGVVVLGVSSAWFVVMCRFPGRKLLQWALLLPLAIPAYILAYVYTDFLQYSGPAQSWLRDVFEWTRNDYVFPEIRSRGGAITMLTLSLYPYVYLLTRSAFLEQSSSLLEASHSLGLNAWRAFGRIALPLARASIVAGVSLALMETLSDYGTVDYFGISTFTTGIYRAWFGFGERATAAQLSSLLLLAVLVLFACEQLSRRRSRHQKQPSGTRYRHLMHYQLSGLRGYIISFLCFIPVIAGFILPFLLLVRMTFQNFDWGTFTHTPLLEFIQSSTYSWEYARNSLLLASISGFLIVIIALFIAYAVRLNPHIGSYVLSRSASLGYAVPGSVIGVGILLSLSYLQDLTTHFNLGTIIAIGSPAGLIFAYIIRFLAVAVGGIQASLNKITQNIDEAAQSLGYHHAAILWRVHIPLLRQSLFTAGLLVFVDAMKELPATLIIRPFNFDTLAVRVYRLASDERLVDAAGDALMIVLTGILPVIILSTITLRQQR